MAKKKNKIIKQRDGNIVKSFQKECNMVEKTIKDKSKYTRKTKHKKKDFEY